MENEDEIIKNILCTINDYYRLGSIYSSIDSHGIKITRKEAGVIEKVIDFYISKKEESHGK